MILQISKDAINNYTDSPYFCFWKTSPRVLPFLHLYISGYSDSRTTWWFGAPTLHTVENSRRNYGSALHHHGSTDHVVLLYLLLKKKSRVSGAMQFKPILFTGLSSVQFSRSVVSDSLQPHESQHTRPCCPSTSPRVHPNSHPSSQWCQPAISSSVVPFSSCPQSLPASGSFPMSQLFTWGGQSIGVSASASVLPMNTEDWSPLGWNGCISLQSKGLTRVFSSTTVQKHQFFGAQPSSQSNSHIHTWPLEKR